MESQNVSTENGTTQQQQDELNNHQQVVDNESTEETQVTANNNIEMNHTDNNNHRQTEQQEQEQQSQQQAHQQQQQPEQRQTQDIPQIEIDSPVNNNINNVNSINTNNSNNRYRDNNNRQSPSPPLQSQQQQQYNSLNINNNNSNNRSSNYNRVNNNNNNNNVQQSNNSGKDRDIAINENQDTMFDRFVNSAYNTPPLGNASFSAIQKRQRVGAFVDVLLSLAKNAMTLPLDVLMTRLIVHRFYKSDNLHYINDCTLSGICKNEGIIKGLYALTNFRITFESPVIKVRLNIRNIGFFKTLSTIYRREGIRGLFSGLNTYFVLFPLWMIGILFANVIFIKLKQMLERNADLTRRRRSSSKSGLYSTDNSQPSGMGVMALSPMVGSDDEHSESEDETISSDTDETPNQGDDSINDIDKRSSPITTTTTTSTTTTNRNI
ncbi:mitochondrial substrate carrier family protein [Heterostelium album PN500]|uniref:Mitochondrial substrate carrier family protein n=1 Tax=Heterostelium pallidum (strain ATCC 26659 / Pp 5 / PN500) TaxID=670386 RepID=D3BPP3_HETP5|nr:mitochondrial substrate carrier family protein [Heterostelium album PN500]EFA76605.1 mitochondrial substrate carrier family protein [Heterostelium album PN500]|eukprot:XP_020428737.1 mitochondrial substrate carrier family protein [Heterostelium album PN500]